MFLFFFDAKSISFVGKVNLCCLFLSTLTLGVSGNEGTCDLQVLECVFFVFLLVYGVELLVRAVEHGCILVAEEETISWDAFVALVAPELVVAKALLHHCLHLDPADP